MGGSGNGRAADALQDKLTSIESEEFTTAGVTLQDANAAQRKCELDESVPDLEKLGAAELDAETNSTEDQLEPGVERSNSLTPSQVSTPLMGAPTPEKDPGNSFHKGEEIHLSASAETMDLDLTLGSLESKQRLPFPKRKRLHHSPGSPNSPRKKSLAMKSAAEALNAKFWNDGASVSEENVPSCSFDVADDDAVGGSSPIQLELDHPRDADYRQRMDGNVEKIVPADMTSGSASCLGDDDEVATPSSVKKTLHPEATRDDTQQGSSEDVMDFDNGLAAQSNKNDDLPDASSDISSVSSFVESYPEDEESKPFPPAPPSTPATAKDMCQPLPFHSDNAAGSLEYSLELKGSQGSSHEQQNQTSPNILAANQGPPLMPENDYGDETDTPRPTNTSYRSAATAETPRGGDATPDISGDVTRRAQSHASNQEQEQKKEQLKLMRNSDFEHWDVGARYELKRILGRGSYGEVAQAVDLHEAKLQELRRGQPQRSKSNLASTHRSVSYVAVKKISKAFDQEVDAVRLFREMHILRRLRGHECIIQLVDVVQPRSSDLTLFNDLYLVFEYVDTDLYKLIMSPQYLTTEHIQTFLYQMLVGLKYIHSSSVIHRDLKPAILLNEDCTLKICDFGLARIVHNEKMKPTPVTTPTNVDSSRLSVTPTPAISSVPQTIPTDIDRDQLSSIPRPSLSRQLTKHVVTRWYRAPELILIQPYASAVDIWSLGCIFAELLSMQEGSVPTYQDRVPLFPGGSCYPLSGDTGSSGSDERLDQLSVIFSVIGMPSEEDLKSVGKATEYIKSLERKPGRNLDSLYPAADPTAIDLLKTMLMFNPAKRCTAVQALEHEFLQPVRRKDMEKYAKEPLVSPVFLDKNRIDLNTLKEETYKEVLWYKDTTG